MKLAWNQIQQYQDQSRLWILSGVEPLLMEETRQSIRDRYAGFEKQSIFIDVNFDWRSFELNLQNQGLFSAQELIELIFPEGKAGRSGSNWLKQLKAHITPDRHWIIHAPDTKANWVQQTAWIKSLMQHGVHVHHPNISSPDRQHWARQHLSAQSLTIENNALHYIDFMCEGNLLALKQELDKLVMLGDTPVTEVQVRAQSQDQARFSVFDFIELLFNKKGRKALRVCRLLRGDGIDPNFINAMLIREVAILIVLSELQNTRQPMDAYFKSIGAWSARQRQLMNWVSVYTSEQLLKLQLTLGEIDKECKGLSSRDPWLSLEYLIFTIGFDLTNAH